MGRDRVQVCVTLPACSAPPTQRCLDWNRDILKKELGLTEQDIIDLPALFKMDEGRQARAFFPNMVSPRPKPRGTVRSKGVPSGHPGPSLG